MLIIYRFESKFVPLNVTLREESVVQLGICWFVYLFFNGLTLFFFVFELNRIIIFCNFITKFSCIYFKVLIWSRN